MCVCVCVFPACDDIELHYFAFGDGVIVIVEPITFNDMVFFFFFTRTILMFLQCFYIGCTICLLIMWVSSVESLDYQD